MTSVSTIKSRYCWAAFVVAVQKPSERYEGTWNINHVIAIQLSYFFPEYKRSNTKANVQGLGRLRLLNSRFVLEDLTNL